MQGFPALISRCRGAKAKLPRDQQDADTKTRQVERWLAEESEHAHHFGNKNTEAPEALKKEAARKLVFDSKVRVGKNVVRMEKDIDAELSPTKPSAKPPPGRAYSQSPFPSQPPGLFSASFRRNLFVHPTPSATATVKPHVRDDHRLLQDRISNLLQFNIRLVDSELQSTITRLPFHFLLADRSLLKTAVGGFTGDDVSMAKLVDFAQQNIPLGLLKAWKEHGHGIELTHAQGKSLADDDDFAVAVNDFINGPRKHTDMCITLVLSTGDALMTGTYIVYSYPYCV